MSPSRTASPETLDSILSEAVRIRLPRDLPVAALFSGGIDSTLIAHYARRTRPEAPGYFLGDEDAQKYYFGKRFDATSIIESKGAFQTQMDAVAAEKAAYERGLAEVRDSLKELAEKYTGDPTGFAVAVYGRHGHAGKITDEDLAWAEEAIARMEAKKASPLSDAPAPAPKRRVVQIIPQTQYTVMMAFCDDDTLFTYTTDGWKQLPPIPQPGDTP